MSKQELLDFVAPLSMEERRELHGILEAEFAQGDEATRTFFAWRNSQPPLDLPQDFSVNHDHYIHGAPKVDE